MKTKYRLLVDAAEIDIGDNQVAKVEKIIVNETNQEEIRFSWWKDSRFQARPLDLPEGQWLELFHKAIESNIFTSEFKKNLIKILNKGYK
ncbi:hypothetical protein E9840_11240 [Tissierella creatinini]|nr:hypothetical protein E9840_11240 [Tissierella creatinini]TJX62909.1 hypothetical protein E8P77_16295 [Soehngenia saccharolytica]